MIAATGRGCAAVASRTLVNGRGTDDVRFWLDDVLLGRARVEHAGGLDRGGPPADHGNRRYDRGRLVDERDGLVATHRAQLRRRALGLGPDRARRLLAGPA